MFRHAGVCACVGACVSVCDRFIVLSKICVLCSCDYQCFGIYQWVLFKYFANTKVLIYALEASATRTVLGC